MFEKIKKTVGGAILKGIGKLKDDDIIWKSIRAQTATSELTENNAYAKNVWVYGSIKTIADNISRVPLKIFKKNTEGDILNRKEVENDKINKLFQNPNPLMSQRQLIEATMIYYELYGRAFWLLDERDDVTKLPKEIWVFNPSRFKPKIDEMGRIVAWLYNIGTNPYDEITIPLHQILYFRQFNPYEDVGGLSALTPAKSSVDQDYYAGEYNRVFFKNGADLGGYIELEEELSPDAYNRLIRSLEDRHQGFDKNNKVGVIEGGGKYKSGSKGAKDLDFANLKKLARKEVLSAFKTNEVVLGIYDEVKSFEGIRAAHKAFWQEVLVPKITYIEEVINNNFIKKLSGRYVAKFDLDSVEALRDDLTKKVNMAWILTRMGFPINDINKRLELGMDKVEWGDDWWINSSLIKANESPGPEDASTEETDGNKKKPGAAAKDPKEPNASSDQGGDKDDKKNDKKEVKPESYKTQVAFHRYLQKQFDSKFSRFLFEQRKEVVDNLLVVSKDFKVMSSPTIIDNVFPEKEASKLKAFLKPIYSKSVKVGAEGVASEIVNPDFVFDTSDFEYVISARLNVVPEEIVNEVKRQLNLTLLEGIDAGDSLDDIIIRIKKIYNAASSKAKLLAKTEAFGAMNDGRFAAMQRYNIKEHSWYCNGDCHSELSGKTVTLGDSFGADGIRYPYDLSATNLQIGCDCITIAKNNEEE